ncbi:hypothetical protein DFH28DRAFT_1118020 [Melampsora americana]|nr:hypothetical protein DFH28DRAFT_1118020 [Melampsora americana]
MARSFRVGKHCSNVYLYYDNPKASPDAKKGNTSKWTKLLITGCPENNLHNHRCKGPALAKAWANHKPGSIAPDKDPLAATERQKAALHSADWYTNQQDVDVQPLVTISSNNKKTSTVVNQF